mmetsp:Transcript_31685/g.53457  ORF Transcript_31685/g.53457 Transcript_31685/m.53457 type:complete len:285 (+) Transcript_31685:1211-2065(+)
MGMAEVLEAKMAWGGRTASISWSTRCFTLSSSKTASMTKSAPAKCFFHAAMSSWRGIRRELVSQNSWLVMRLFFSLPFISSMITFSPLLTPASSLSFSSTRYLPLSTDTCAIPAPINPAPKTATFFTGWAGLPKSCFFTAVMPWNMPMSASDSGVAASSANWVASSSKWVFLDFPMLSLSRLMILYGEGYLPPVVLSTVSLALLNMIELRGVSSRAIDMRSFFLCRGFTDPSTRPFACATATLSREAGSTTRSTRPSFLALSGRTFLPVSIISKAVAYPTMRGK